MIVFLLPQKVGFDIPRKKWMGISNFIFVYVCMDVCVGGGGEGEGLGEWRKRRNKKTIFQNVVYWKFYPVF